MGAGERQSGNRWGPIVRRDLPDGLVLLDGECVFCSGWAAFVIRRDPGTRFRFLAIQTPRGEALARELGIDPADPETNAVIADGRAWFKSCSALMVLARLPGWRWTRLFWLVPKPVRDFAYDRVARNRYALFGRTVCRLPDDDVAARFL